MGNIDKIKKIRELTGAGIVEIKKALDEVGDDLDKAIQLLNEKGLLKAEKKTGRTTGASLLEAFVHNKRIGVLLQVSAETDFAAHSEPVQLLSRDLAMQIASMNPQSVEELCNQPFVKNEKLLINDVIKQTIAKVGENITIDKFCRYEI